MIVTVRTNGDNHDGDRLKLTATPRTPSDVKCATLRESNSADVRILGCSTASVLNAWCKSNEIWADMIAVRFSNRFITDVPYKPDSPPFASCAEAGRSHAVCDLLPIVSGTEQTARSLSHSCQTSRLTDISRSTYTLANNSCQLRDGADNEPFHAAEGSVRRRTEPFCACTASIRVALEDSCRSLTGEAALTLSAAPNRINYAWHVSPQFGQLGCLICQIKSSWLFCGAPNVICAHRHTRIPSMLTAVDRWSQGPSDIFMKTFGALAAAQIALMPAVGPRHRLALDLLSTRCLGGSLSCMHADELHQRLLSANIRATTAECVACY